MPDAAASPDPWFLDRFEGGLAVLLRGTFSVNVPRDRLPPGTREGDWLRAIETEDAQAAWVPAGPAVADAARWHAEELLREMRARDDGADVVM